MEKRTLLAVVLSAAVFIIYYGFFYTPPPPVKSPVIATAATSPSATPGVLGTAPAVASPSGSMAVIPPVNNTPEVRNSLDSSVVQAQISSHTGLPAEWQLKKYFIKPDNKGPNINLLQDIVGSLPMGLLLFPGQAPVQPNYTLAQPAGNALNYQAQVGDIALQEKLEFLPTEYTLQISLVLENRGTNPAALSPGLRLEVEQSPPSQKGFLIFKEAPNFKFPVYRVGTGVKRQHNVQKLGAFQEEVGEISWAGLEDHYFLRMMLARNVSAQNRVAYGNNGNAVFTQLQYGPESLAPGQKREYQFTLYFGPKDPALLKKFGEAQLDKAVDYGWFGFIALPILTVLKLFYSFLHNWGLAIIALTLLIKLLLHPLTRKSMQSMKAMQTLQPQLQKLREKYADDREQLNLQTMDLFKTHKVNPMGGCLPMLIQMPIYIALYKVLYNATDLYHAPFFAFYHDLSAPDPYYVLPILLGIFMVLQQKMTPSTADPAQAKMMMIMPVMFSLFMIFLPLGLVLYIFVNTSLTVLQQWMNQRDLTFSDLFRGGKKSTA
ncbi:MAG: membrane protein insertase YidC [Deltaproteobacteria bacterium]|nr:membrane protein insertase YidC [Deltaproteobacteria bacterium]